MQARTVNRRFISIIAVISMLAALLAAVATSPAGAAEPITIQLLHNNDGESQLLSDDEGFGGAARFKTLLDNLRASAATSGYETILVSSGDNFLAGPEFQAGLNAGVFYDAIALEAFGYDAIAIGNHDFDFGPDLLADFLNSYTDAPQYVSANLDFTNEPGLQALATSGVIAASTVVTKGGEQFGIVGATTPDLPSISSPRDVVVGENVAAAIQAEIDALTGTGVDKIIVISHLQSIEEDLALAPMLSGVDVMVAGGGDELLANEGDLLLPGDEGNVFDTYPIVALNKDGDEVPVVTTSGSYRYVGSLTLSFDAAGKLTSWDGGPVRVSGVAPDAVTEDAALKSAVTDPVAAALDGLGTNVIATSAVALDGRRAPGVRTMETNQGNLDADSMLWQARRLATSFGVKTPDVAIQNGGGIRNDSIVPAGDYTELDTFDALPFSNFVTVVEDIPAAQFKEILENAYSAVEFNSGRFAQIAGFSVVYDPSRTPMDISGEDDVTVLQAGERVISAYLDDGTPIIEGGSVVPGAPAVTIAIADFLAKGGDQYPFRDAPFTTLGVTYQQALFNYITAPVADGGLGGMISAADYPEGGENRIVALEGAAVGVVRNGRWSVPGADPFFFGVAGDIPFLGDWNGDGVKTPGMYRPSTGFAYVTDGLKTATADRSWYMGIKGDIPIVGDWDGDGVDSFGVYRPTNGKVFLRNQQTTGIAEVEYFFGAPGDSPFAGDFDGDGIDSVGLFRASNGKVYFRNDQSTGIADADFFFGQKGDRFVAGDWNNDGIDTVGVVRPSTNTFFGRNSNDLGFADFSFAFDGAKTPVVTAADIPNIVQTAVGAGSFGTLLTALRATGLDGVLANAGPFTVFAPTDAAFDKLPPGLLDDLLADPIALEEILVYHVTEGALTEADLLAEGLVPSLLGPPIEVTAGSTILNGSAMVIAGDIEASNGIVHAIDEVLLPPEPLAVLAAQWMRGSTEVGAPGDPAALGQAFIAVFESFVCLDFARTTAVDPTTVHIHEGAAGVGGGVVVDFGVTGEDWELDFFFDQQLLFGSCVSVDGATTAALAATPEAYYLNIHSEAYPAGAVREQLAIDAGPPPRPYDASLAVGPNEVGTPGDPNGFADFNIEVPPTDNGEWCFAGTAWETDPITAGHIHIGATGVAGGVLVDFEIGSRWPVFDAVDASQLLLGCVPVSEPDQTAIAADPAGFYVNLHAATYPGGALRAQLDTELVPFFLVDMTGDQAVPGPGDPEGFGSTWGIVVDPVQDAVAAVIGVEGIGDPTAMHIHAGAFGAAGGVVVLFDVASMPFSSPGPEFFFETQYVGWVPVDSAVVDAIIADPSGHYVNVHTAEFPAGAIRGQLFDPDAGPPPM